MAAGSKSNTIFCKEIQCRLLCFSNYRMTSVVSWAWETLYRL